MQKREKISGGMVGRLTVVLIVFSVHPEPGSCSDSWEMATGRGTFPGSSHPAADAAGERYLLATVSASNPYSVGGLYGTSADLHVVRSGWTACAGWDRLAAENFSRDLISLRGGIELPRTNLRFYIDILEKITRVSGCGMLSSARTVYSLVLDLRPFICAEAGAGGGIYNFSARASSSSFDLFVTVERDRLGYVTERAGGRLRFPCGLALMTGFVPDTGAVSGGFSFGNRNPVSLSWSSHPVLGTTISFSLGAVR